MAEAAQVGVAEDLRDHDRVRAVAQQVRRARPAEGVKIDLLGNARRLRVPAYGCADAFLVHARAGLIQPEGVRRGANFGRSFGRASLR